MCACVWCEVHGHPRSFPPPPPPPPPPHLMPHSGRLLARTDTVRPVRGIEECKDVDLFSALRWTEDRLILSLTKKGSNSVAHFVLTLTNSQLLDATPISSTALAQTSATVLSMVRGVCEIVAEAQHSNVAQKQLLR